MNKTRYNPKVYVDNYPICNHNKSQIKLHIHHIIEQRHADIKGLVDKVIKADDGSS
jgi:hypothetical protein